MDLVENAVKNLVEKGAFGAAKFVSVSFGDEEKNVAHFASVINFIEINIDDGETKTIKAVLKRSPQIEEIRNVFNSDLQFKNEIFMYSEIIPFLICENIAPKLYHGDCTDKKEFMILEDLKSKGYRHTQQKTSLDLKHLLIAVEKLGKFHGSSYKAKRNGAELHKLSLFKGKDSEDFYFMAYNSMLRGIKATSGDKELEKLVEKMANMKELLVKLQEPEEPFGAICHGDFNRNNMLFIYENEEAKDVRFYDFQMSRYNSPATDLSFLLYMNTDVETRKDWDLLLEVYWKGVTSVEENPGFGFEQFCQHFAERALYGYVLSSFYLPMMMNPEGEFQREPEATIEEKVAVMMTLGGEKGTEAVVNILQHLIQRGYIQAFNNSY